MDNDRRRLLELGGATLLAAPFAAMPGLVLAAKREPYQEEEVYREAKEFFTTGAEELSDVLGAPV